MYHFLVYLLIVFFVCATAERVVVNVRCGDETNTNPLTPCGIYFPEEVVTADRRESHESLLAVLNPLSNQREAVSMDSSIVLRSGDLRTRVRVEVRAAADEISSGGNPYILSISNMAFADRPEPNPVELQHSNSGYIWIEPGHVVSHNTDVNHPFVIRDNQKQVVFALTLNFLDKAEL